MIPYLKIIFIVKEVCMSFIPFLQVSSSQGSSMMPMIIIILVFVIMYFFMIRPQNKKQKETEKMISALKKGDRIVTIGGIHGEITSTKEQTVIVKVDDACKIEFTRSAIASVETDEKTTKPGKSGKEKAIKKEKIESVAEEPAEDEKK